MANRSEVLCPGCGLSMPADPGAEYTGYFHCSPECWAVFLEVAGFEYGNPAQVWQVHQLLVDTYAVQHAGGLHPDKSVAVHLAGLYLALEQKVSPPEVAPLLKRIADRVSNWPHFDPPPSSDLPTILEIALADSSAEHRRLVREWAALVWATWPHAREEIRKLVDENL